MDSEDDLPAFEPTYMPSPVNAPNISLQPSSEGEDYADALVSLGFPPDDESLSPLTSDSDEDDMPMLMSVSDSSEEQDEFVDDDNSEWEDEDDAEFDEEDLPPLESFSPARSRDETPPLIPITLADDDHSRQAEPSRLSPRDMSLEELPNFLSNFSNMHILDGLRLGTRMAASGSAGPIPREVLEDIIIHHVARQEDSRLREPDPERAKVLVQGLEGVPNGLLVRMARVGGAPGALEDLSGDEESAISGCAVCWAPLLDEDLNQAGSAGGKHQPPSQSGEGSKIVSLPCAHVFHSACLLPWFSQPNTTTCPTCRFDIDPDALTWKPAPRRQERPSTDASFNTARNGVPVDDWEDQTDEEDEEDTDDEDTPEFLDSVINFDNMFFNNIFASGGLPRPDAHTGVPRDTWTLPSAPGKTLRERITETEHEMGLRCMNLTCVFAPTDDDPYPRGADTPQISIRMMETSRCKHRLHPACLVMSARVGGRVPSLHETEVPLVVEVLCPSCRTVGTVSKKEWDEGVKALALIDC